VTINSTGTTYNIGIPYSSALPSGAVKLALALVDYHQTFDSTNEVFYYLLEDYPMTSNNTHAIFYAYIQFPDLTTRFKIRYLVCPTSILSRDFNIIINQFSIATATYPVNTNTAHIINDNLNTVGSWSASTWISAIIASRPTGATTLQIQASFTTTPSNRIVTSNSVDNITLDTYVKITLIFINNDANVISGYRTIQLSPINIASSPISVPMNNYGGWTDKTNIICGV
jgi:hypothetical protein